MWSGFCVCDPNVRRECSNDVDELPVDREHCKAYMAGRALLRSMIQQFDEPSKIIDNYLLSSVTVWCVCAVVCDADDELLAEHGEPPTENEDFDPSFNRMCNRLKYRMESCWSQHVRVRLCAARFRMFAWPWIGNAIWCCHAELFSFQSELACAICSCTWLL